MTSVKTVIILRKGLSTTRYLDFKQHVFSTNTCLYIFVYCKCFSNVQLFLDYTAETYSKFMQGEDTFDDEDETFLTKLSKHSNCQ